MMLSVRLFSGDKGTVKQAKKQENNFFFVFLRRSLFKTFCGFNF
jgi:hypothetical protein